MSKLFRTHAAVISIAAVAGFAAGRVGASIENYYLKGGPSFTSHPLEPLRYLGYPGFWMAGRTGEPGFIDLRNSYEVHKVVLWNALSWGAAAAAVCGVLAALRRGKRTGSRPSTAM